MNTNTYWLSRVMPQSDIPFQKLLTLGGLDPYRQHQELYKLFDLPPRHEQTTNETTPFLYRMERIEPGSAVGHRFPERVGLPVFYVLSKQKPVCQRGLWHIETPPAGYCPDIRSGDRLAFKLRVNPTITHKVLRDEDTAAAWRKNREKSGFNTKEQPPRKRTRHDVVMAEKYKIGWKNLPFSERPALAQLAYRAGCAWLTAKAQTSGFAIETSTIPDYLTDTEVETSTLRVDGYTTWRQQNRRKIQISMLDFEGSLVVTDSERFNKALYQGIGPAKAFGCGLLMVRRL